MKSVVRFLNYYPKNSKIMLKAFPIPMLLNVFLIIFYY
jgi:hypothetical protein